jgi:hypothetical protein
MDRNVSAENPLTWTPEAQARLQHVPEGVMRELTRQRVERLARQRAESSVTVELVEAKYTQWADGSARATSEAVWSEEARERIERVPAFVRGMVVEAVEAYARSHGLVEITPETLEMAKGSWEGTGQFHRP